MPPTAGEVIGEPDAEGDGTVIGEFGALETAVNDVTAAIGSADSEGIHINLIAQDLLCLFFIIDNSIFRKIHHCWCICNNTITINIKVNGDIPAFASGTVLGNMQIDS